MSDPLKKSSDKNIIEQMLRERAQQELRGVAERQIVEAQEKGLFDNLEGKGRPLPARKKHQAGDQALAFELLQNNDYTVPWIAARKEMLDAIDSFRSELKGVWDVYRRRLRVAQSEKEWQFAREEWQRDLQRLTEDLRALNQKITALNLTIPVERLEVFKLSLSRELARAGIKD